MTNVRSLVVAALLLVAAGLYLWPAPGDAQPTPPAASTTENTAAADRPNSGDTAGPSGGISGLPTIAVADLPPEALDTLDAIAAGGPYDFAKDDSIFQNREGILPDREHGYYREYTVVTPGEDERGARRIVSGADGEQYYTDDHYGSFSEIVG